MPNLKLTNLASYRAYFAAIAASHVDIDGYKWGDKDVIKNDNRSDMPARMLWATPYDSAKYGDKSSDNVVKTKVARVAYLILSASELFADEDEAFDKCEAVMEQVLAKLYKDKTGYDVSGEWNMIATNINAWTGGPVEMKIGSTEYIGWEIEIPFMDNTNLEYDPLKWA